MSKENKELEVKFYVADLENMERKLMKLGAKMIRHRSHEYNLRFDTPQGKLSRDFQALRLRQDDEIHLTYKGPSSTDGGARLREEIEVKVSNFEDTQAIFEALGYQVHLVYEKYREIHALDNVIISLDEMPYGNFIEIEGENSVDILVASKKLDLDWNCRVQWSYLELFFIIKAKLAVSIDNLTFKDFSDIEISSELLGVQPADE